jgi:hypothetical protein
MSKLFTLTLVLAAAAMPRAQIAVDREIVARIRAEGLERSQAQAVFDELTIAIGPRLTASPAHKRAVDFMVERLKA